MKGVSFIYESLNKVGDLKTGRTDEGLMSLTGCFGVCGVRNRNHRVYETRNYSNMITEMKGRISRDGGIPGELEHPKTMNVDLGNISHKITDINIDENGMVTGTIVLLNTPKGQIARAIVEGGLPLFISSRATGQVDKSTGNVTLEHIETYDLVGTPGFAQARLNLNENQIAESLGDNIYYITENTNDDNMNESTDLKELLERIKNLEESVEELQDKNDELEEALDSKDNFDLKKLADGIQGWITEEFAPTIQKWITEEFAPEVQNWIIEDYSPEVQKWVTEEFGSELKDSINEDINFKEYVRTNLAPGIEKWVTEDFASIIQEWAITEFAPGIQKWVTEEFAPENTMNIKESLNIENVSASIDKNAIVDKLLSVMEGLEVQKATYPGKAVMISEGASNDEPLYIREMPADIRVKWNMAPQNIKESVTRRAKLYNFMTEGAVERFWKSINFDQITPSTNIYEGLDNIPNERERSLRMQLRKWHNK